VQFPLTDADRWRLHQTGPFDIQGYPFYPLLSPEMPPPGPNFLKFARDITNGEDDSRPAPVKATRQSPALPAHASSTLSTLYWQALYDPYFALPIAVGERTVWCKFIPGHLYKSPADGPRPADVMVIGKHPGRDEETECQHFVGPTSQHFWNACEQIGIPDAELQGWYLTNIVRFNNPDPNKATLPSSWLADCAPVFAEELRIVRPRYILCLGAEASKAVIGYNVDQMRGRVEQLRYPIHLPGEPPEFCVAQVMTATHPARVHREPERMDDLRSTIHSFYRLTQGYEIGAKERDLDHGVIFTESELSDIVDQILDEARQNPEYRWLAVDAEWHGDKPWIPNAYLRTIQFSHKEKFARCVALRHAGGAEAFDTGVEGVTRQLRRLFLDPIMRIGGHFLRADIPWIHHFTGIDLREKYAPADTPERCPHEGGWDTSLMEHAVCETALLGLDILRAKYTTAPAYEVALTKWLKKYCSLHGIEEKDIDGFGDWEGEDFYYYALMDADVTRRIVTKLRKALDADRFQHDCWKPYWRTHSASLAVLEMEVTGLRADPKRVDDLANTYAMARGAIVQHLRELIRWPTFNPNSDQQCRVMLFGEQFGGRKEMEPGLPDIRPLPYESLTDAVKRVKKDIREGRVAKRPDGEVHWGYLKPEGALTLDLTPITSTGKRPKAWEKVVAKKETDIYKPSTGRETLGILGHKNPVVSVLRDIRFLTKALQTVLREPETDPDTGERLRDDSGEYVFEKGLMSYRGPDGKVHTRIRQTMETGRSSSSSPPLQNQTSRREDDYKAMLGYWGVDKDTGLPKPEGRYLKLLGEPRYQWPQKTIFTADPGYVLINSDYTGAELAGIMWLAGDAQGTEDVRRNLLPPSHPDYLDLHANNAVNAFNLLDRDGNRCAPTKKALEALGRKGLRVAAKSVAFGIPYGRGAEAIARQCREEGVETSVDDAQKLIDGYFNRYQRVGPFLEACQRRPYEPMWMCGYDGRYRRFHWSADEQVLKEQERQACNFPIQNLVADSVWAALAAMWKWRERTNIPFQFLLQIHDAVLLHVPIEHAPRVYREIFQACMVDAVPIWPCDLDGQRLSVERPYYLGCDREIMFRWGETIDDEIVNLIEENKPAADLEAIARLRGLSLAV